LVIVDLINTPLSTVQSKGSLSTLVRSTYLPLIQFSHKEFSKNTGSGHNKWNVDKDQMRPEPRRRRQNGALPRPVHEGMSFLTLGCRLVLVVQRIGKLYHHSRCRPLSEASSWLLILQNKRRRSYRKLLMFFDRAIAKPEPKVSTVIGLDLRGMIATQDSHIWSSDFPTSCITEISFVA
jgi:hypothetical protein